MNLRGYALSDVWGDDSSVGSLPSSTPQQRSSSSSRPRPLTHSAFQEEDADNTVKGANGSTVGKYRREYNNDNNNVYDRAPTGRKKDYNSNSRSKRSASSSAIDHGQIIRSIKRMVDRHHHQRDLVSSISSSTPANDDNDRINNNAKANDFTYDNDADYDNNNNDVDDDDAAADSMTSANNPVDDVMLAVENDDDNTYAETYIRNRALPSPPETDYNSRPQIYITKVRKKSKSPSSSAPTISGQQLPPPNDQNNRITIMEQQHEQDVMHLATTRANLEHAQKQQQRLLIGMIVLLVLFAVVVVFLFRGMQQRMTSLVGPLTATTMAVTAASPTSSSLSRHIPTCPHCHHVL